MKKLIAGNWKMNGDKDFAGNLTETLARFLPDYKEAMDKCDVLLCPPFLHLGIVQNVVHEQGAPVSLGAQNCCERDNGAVTGEVSAQMLANFGCSYVILGHSERREYYGESDNLVAAKAQKAHEAGLTAIICVGEKEDERMAGHQEKIVGRQLEKACRRPRGRTIPSLLTSRSGRSGRGKRLRLPMLEPCTVLFAKSCRKDLKIPNLSVFCMAVP